VSETGRFGEDAVSGIMIDAPDTKDRDDAIWVRRHDDGFDAWAHIALVSARLPQDCAADVEARRRMHSRYLPDHTIGMLPSTVESEATLRTGTEQATLRIHMRLSADGELLETSIAEGNLSRSWVMSYAEAAEALRDPEIEPHHRLAEAHQLATILLNRRQSAGALAFYDLFKGYATNEEGQLVRLGDTQRNAGYIVVQELMVAANTAIAMWCAARDLPILFRNHRAAAVAGSRQDILAELAAAELHGDGTGYELLRKRLGVVQRPATYEPVVFGHRGLSLVAYTHATSPLRRYPDLINQRILMAVACGRPSPYDFDALDTIGTDLNTRIQAERERRSERHKAAARRMVRERLTEAEFDDLDAVAFSKVLRMGLAQSPAPKALIAEATRRFDTASLPLRDACEILTAGREPQWQQLRERVNDTIAQEPTQALTIVSMYAQSVIGGPVGETQMKWELRHVGTAHQPRFEAKLTLDLGDVVHESPRRVQASKKDAKAQAAFALLAQLTELQDLSRSADVPAPDETRELILNRIPADRNPAMAVNEYAQLGAIDNPVWTFDRTGPPHEPVFTCTVSAVLNADSTRLEATGTGPAKQQAKACAASRLRTLIEARLNTTIAEQR
jgi:ribonuclease R